ncbi:MAG: DUF1704 domain-containing protein, partial [Polyangiaceae bacterium]|nr:DUF1704 domain-containing protein [Polyangiaceae bacterium]
HAIELGARLLEAAGTKRFFAISKELYGTPTTPLLDGHTTSLMLARRLDKVLRALDHGDLGPPQRTLTATALARRMRIEMRKYLGDSSPTVVLVEHSSAKAVAGARRIKLRLSARFTDDDVRQLVMHEAMVHIATSLNGRAQRDLPLLAAGHPGTTRTQEGLAVFSEIVSGAMAPDRFRRLSDRVLAIQMAIEGADFLDVYRFFLDQHDDPTLAFENARRVVRGGLVQGGAPFTKDGVYLDGLVRVHDFLRVAVKIDRVDVMPLLFCGKLDLEDLPAFASLSRTGLLRYPRFLPPWAANRRFLVSYLAYSGFLNRVKLRSVEQHYRELLSDAPRVPSAPGMTAAQRSGGLDPETEAAE